MRASVTEGCVTQWRQGRAHELLPRVRLSYSVKQPLDLHLFRDFDWTQSTHALVQRHNDTVSIFHYSHQSFGDAVEFHLFFKGSANADSCVHACGWVACCRGCLSLFNQCRIIPRCIQLTWRLELSCSGSVWVFGAAFAGRAQSETNVP